MEPSSSPHHKKEEPVGPFVGIVLVVLVLLVGGIYFFLNKQNDLRKVPPLEYYDQA